MIICCFKVYVTRQIFAIIMLNNGITQTRNAKKSSFGSPARVVCYPLLTSAVPQLQSAGTFACCVSSLGHYVPSYLIWYIEISFSIPILTLCLGWTLVPHKQAAYRQPRSQTVRKPSLQVAGLQVHDTTLNCWCLSKTANLT